jgi:hypothetical protein
LEDAITTTFWVDWWVDALCIIFTSSLLCKLVHNSAAVFFNLFWIELNCSQRDRWM